MAQTLTSIRKVLLCVILFKPERGWDGDWCVFAGVLTGYITEEELKATPVKFEVVVTDDQDLEASSEVTLNIKGRTFSPHVCVMRVRN